MRVNRLRHRVHELDRAAAGRGGRAAVQARRTALGGLQRRELRFRSTCLIVVLTPYGVPPVSCVLKVCLAARDYRPWPSAEFLFFEVTTVQMLNYYIQSCLFLIQSFLKFENFFLNK